MKFVNGSGFTNNTFGLRLSGTAGSTYILQVSTNLVDWSDLSANTPSSNLFSLFDTNATRFPSRFYRVMQLP